jgi:hypothetical protein
MTQFLPALLALLMHGSFGLGHEASSRVDGRDVPFFAALTLAQHGSKKAAQDSSHFIAAYIAYLKEDASAQAPTPKCELEPAPAPHWVAPAAITVPVLSGKSPRDGPSRA